MSIAPFPHRYTVAIHQDALLSDADATIRIGAPPQFGGSDDVWSPEQLLVGAVLACVKTTFEAYAAKQKLGPYNWTGSATGVLVKGPQGPVFDCVDVEVEIVTEPGAEERARELMKTVERSCIVSRALAVSVHIASSVITRVGLRAS